MKPLLSYLCLCAAALAAAVTAARGQTPVLAWDAEASAARPAQADVYRGETVALRPAFLERGAPADTNGAAFTLYWQTNGMGAAWWSDPTNAFRWTPARDCGAAAYTLFIRCDTAAGASYRANARLRMLDSPGAVPNALPLPVQTLDFSTITLTNAPWVTADDWQSGSNSLAAAVQPLGPRLDLIEAGTNAWQTAYSWKNHALAGYLLPADISGLATTQQVAQAAAAIPRDRIITQDGSQWIDATGGVWRAVEGTGGWALTLLSYPYEAHVGEIDWYAPAGYSEYADPGWWALYVESTGTGFDISVITGFGEWGADDVQPISPITLSPVGMGAEGDVTLWLSGDVNTSRVDGVAWQSDLPLYATTQQVAAALAPMATTGYVAQASLADADGYTTQMVMRVGSEIATNIWGPRVTLPEGIVTNGMGGMTATTNSAGVPYVRFSGKGGGWGGAVTIGGHLYFDDWGSRIIFADGSGLNMSSMYFAAGVGGFAYWNGAAQAYSLRVDFGNVSVPYGNLTVAGAIYQAGELVATTQHVAEVKELHADSFTNLVWKSVYSNGWHWLVAYTNTPGGAE